MTFEYRMNGLSVSQLINSAIDSCNSSLIVTDKEFLSKKCFDVTPDQATRILSKLEEAFKNNRNAVGVAANQIGIPARVSLIIVKGKRTELINPIIVSGENELIHCKEACLSIPGRIFNVKRYKDFVIKNNVLENGSFREQTEYYYNDDREDATPDITCFAVQHEINHMDGIMIDDTGVELHPDVKVGRNDPCPCNSGKKYKKCCGVN